jgi:hypothetical protein
MRSEEYYCVLETNHGRRGLYVQAQDFEDAQQAALSRLGNMGNPEIIYTERLSDLSETGIRMPLRGDSA